MKAVLRPLCLLLLSTAMLPAIVLANQSPAIDLRQQMGDEQFRAAGLDKLSAQELTVLTAWLRGDLERTTAAVLEQAKEEGRQEVIVRHRGFLTFDSNEPIVARVTGSFPGLGKGKQFTLDNGQVWEQTDGTTLSGVRDSLPQLRITPGIMGAWYLQLEGFNTRARVRRIK